MDKESKFYLRLKLLSSSLGKSINQIAKELGYSRNALNNYKCRGEPSAVRLLELENYFEVSPEFMIGKNLDKDVKSIKEIFELSLDWILSLKGLNFK